MKELRPIYPDRQENKNNQNYRQYERNNNENISKTVQFHNT